MALLKKCRCGKNIPHDIRYCDKCMAEVDSEDKAKTQRYDREVRHSEDNVRYTTFYNSTPWRTLSDVVKLTFNGLCPVCLVEHERIVESDTTHHIEELRKDWDKRLVESNLIPLCHSCHNEIHSNYKEEDKMYLKEIKEKFKERFKI